MGDVEDEEPWELVSRLDKRKFLRMALPLFTGKFFQQTALIIQLSQSLLALGVVNERSQSNASLPPYTLHGCLCLFGIISARG